MAGRSPAAILYDDAGNPINVLNDGGIIRLQVQAKFPPGQSVLVGNEMPTDPTNIVRQYMQTGGSASDMKVDGSTTPVEFTYSADPTNDIRIYEVRFILGTQNIQFDGASFGSRTALTNGVLINIASNNGTVDSDVANLQISEDLLMFPSPANVILNNTGPKDILVAGILLGGGPILKAGTSDKVTVTVRDDLTLGGAGELQTFKAQVFGVKQ